MIKINEQNINTKDYWDGVYISEEGSGKRRIDDERFGFFAFAVTNWGNANGDFLDVGCGRGEFMVMVAHEFPNASQHGVDISSGAIGLAQNEFGWGFSVGSAEALPYEDEVFDVVWCGETIEHLDDPEKALREMFRVVKKGGIVIVTTPLMHNNPSPEHVWAFSLMDFVCLPHGVLKDIDVRCKGLSMMACWRKP